VHLLAHPLEGQPFGELISLPTNKVQRGGALRLCVQHSLLGLPLSSDSLCLCLLNRGLNSLPHRGGLLGGGRYSTYRFGAGSLRNEGNLKRNKLGHSPHQSFTPPPLLSMAESDHLLGQSNSYLKPHFSTHPGPQ
jgi:hypothetical protein